MNQLLRLAAETSDHPGQCGLVGGIAQRALELAVGVEADVAALRIADGRRQEALLVGREGKAQMGEIQDFACLQRGNPGRVGGADLPVGNIDFDNLLFHGRIMPRCNDGVNCRRSVFLPERSEADGNSLAQNYGSGLSITSVINNKII